LINHELVASAFRRKDKHAANDHDNSKTLHTIFRLKAEATQSKSTIFRLKAEATHSNCDRLKAEATHSNCDRLKAEATQSRSSTSHAFKKFDQHAFKALRYARPTARR
jgi:hypothetical protein